MHLILANNSAAGGAGAGAYEAIASASPTSGTSVSFTSIPSSYKHLQIRAHWKTASSGADLIMRFNNDTASNYAYHYIRGDSAGTVSMGAGPNESSITVQDSDGDYFVASIIDIHDYADTNKYKTSRIFAGRNNNGTSTTRVQLRSGLWMSTSAIDRIDLSFGGTTFSNGSTIALYGIKG